MQDKKTKKGGGERHREALLQKTIPIFRRMRLKKFPQKIAKNVSTGFCLKNYYNYRSPPKLNNNIFPLIFLQVPIFPFFFGLACSVAILFPLPYATSSEEGEFWSIFWCAQIRRFPLKRKGKKGGEAEYFHTPKFWLGPKRAIGGHSP